MAKILIVEDDKALNEAYRLILTKEGHTIETAFNGEEGLGKVEQFKPEIILLDMLMPKMDGLGFLRNFDAHKTHKDIQVIILSNLDMEKQIQEAMELGAARYIIKAHMSPSELAVLINHVIKKMADHPTLAKSR